MKRLTKIIFVQWYLFDSIEIPIVGHTAVVGGNGAGKSSILDGVQLVLAGGDKVKISLNKGSNEKSARTVREYCLGVVSDPNSQSQIQPRDKANSYLVLCFQDDETQEYISAGLSIWAAATEPKEDIKGWFITRGPQLSIDDFTEETKDGICDITWERAKDRLLRKFTLGDTLELPHKGPGDFRRKFYTMMSAEPGMPMNADTVIKSLLSAIAFKPINDPTKFVRENMLEHDNINIRELRDSLKFWRDLRDKANQTKSYIESLAKLENQCSALRTTEQEIHLHEHASLAARIEMSYEKSSPLQVDLDEVEQSLEAMTEEEASVAVEKDQRQKELWQRQQDLERQDVTRKIQQLEDELNIKQKELRGIINSLSLGQSECLKLQVLDDCGPAVPTELKNITEKMVALAHKDEGLMSGLWPESPVEMDEAIRAVLAAANTSVPAMRERLNGLLRKIVPLEEDVKSLKTRIARMGKGTSPVSDKTQGLIDLLTRCRIKAEPLCDLINVTDERWRGAIESILGKTREALIVEPESAREAIRTYRYEGKSFRGARVVNTTKTEEWVPKLKKGSLAEMIETDNKYARAFINYQLGNVMCVETESELTQYSRAATADLMFNSGGVVRSMYPTDAILGWKQQADIKKHLQHKLENEQAELDRYDHGLKRLESAIASTQGFVDKFSQADQSFAEIAVERHALENRSEKIRKEIDLLSQKEDTKLVQLIKGLEETVTRLSARLGELKGDITDLGERRGRLKEAIEEQERFAEALSAALDELIEKHEIDTADAADLLEKLRDKYSDEEDVHQVVVDEIEKKLTSKREKVNKLDRAVVAGLQEFLSTYSAHSLTLGTGELVLDTFEEHATFITDEKARLEETTLADYTSRAEKALSEVEDTFRTKFISRLIEKIEQVKKTIDGLNSILKKRPFHGETYRFQAVPNAELREVLDFAKAIQEDRESQYVGGLFDPANDPTSPHYKAIQFINQAFQDDNTAKLIQDYRNYFTFNVLMFDRDGNKIADLKHRVAKGSGGENMAPFYVAIGSSLSAAYKIMKRGNGEPYGGMNLAPFDEAFSKLDGANCYNCLEFLKDVDLQVLLAAPDDKYTTVVDQVDTVLWVYRDGGDIEIEDEAITRKAHDLLRSDNPFIKVETRQEEAGADAEEAEVVEPVAVEEAVAAAGITRAISSEGEADEVASH